MQIPAFIAISFLLSTAAFSQQKTFEGKIVYKTDVRSLQDGISSATALALLGRDDTVTTFIKEGNCLQVSENFRYYFHHQDEKVYVQYKGVDTLYWFPYQQDTSKVTSVTEGKAARAISGYGCKSLVIKTDQATTEYVYSPLLATNPAFVKNLTWGQLNVFAERTNSIWLANYVTGLDYDFSMTALHIKPSMVDDTIFRLPSLPVTKYRQNALIRMPQFSGEEKSWAAFLQKYIDPGIAAKYLKFKKNQDTVQQTVYVQFVVTTAGEVINAKALNAKNVHPKLAKEAVEVVELSDWKPGAVFGKPVNFPLVQPITFVVVLE